MNIEEKIKTNIILAPLTTFKIGGTAKYFIEVNTKEDLIFACQWASDHREKLVVLAGGSNVLIGSGMLDALVIKIAANNIQLKGERFECGAGCELQKAVTAATSNALTGMEWAAGIPGSIGGAVRGNAGAFGSSISRTLETVDVYDKEKNKFLLFSNNDCEFGYRESIFKKAENLIIWQAVLRLRKGNSRSISEEVASHIESRSKNQPKLPSAGCVFKNLKFNELREANKQLAQMAELEGQVKNNMVGAGWLIDKLDISGKRIGNAKVSLEHCNFIVNTGGASADDVAMLISFIKQKIRNHFGIQLQREIQIIKFD